MFNRSSRISPLSGKGMKYKNLSSKSIFHLSAKWNFSDENVTDYYSNVNSFLISKMTTQSTTSEDSST